MIQYRPKLRKDRPKLILGKPLSHCIPDFLVMFYL
uniref:Uncharacterized protein n=1 Tax=Anguilla anguilla TaxID=7936 RepID=A0A0E9R298_ANGAN